MKRLACCAVGLLLAAAALAEEPPAASSLDAVQIVERNAEARGGLDAWRKVEAMAWSGHVESSSTPGRSISFLLEQKRPANARFEIVVDGQKSIRVFDGSSGWRLRAAANGKPELTPFSPDELKHAQAAPVIEGPLMDYAAKGARMSVVGTDAVAGRPAYVLEVRPAAGGRHRVWVDSETFFELRNDREYQKSSGERAYATVYYNDYRTFGGLQMPVRIETGGDGTVPTSRLVIEKVAINPSLESALFAKPAVAVGRRPGAVVDTRTAGANRPPFGAPK